jgi:hypothetical protein
MLPDQVIAYEGFYQDACAEVGTDAGALDQSAAVKFLADSGIEIAIVREICAAAFGAFGVGADAVGNAQDQRLSFLTACKLVSLQQMGR